MPNPTVDGPTKKQLKWLKCIARLSDQLGRKPTHAELATAMGHEHASVASEMVSRLVKNGWIKNVRIERWEITARAREWM